MALDVGTLFSGIRTVDIVVSKVLSKKGTRIDNKIQAVSVMQKAINSTRIFLVQQNYNYQPNNNLSNLWLEAFTAMIKIDKRLAERLRQKSKFWTNPNNWLDEQGAMELVPDLNELDERCDIITEELNRRK